LRIFLWADWRPRRVCFAHDAPADRSVHERLFGPHVEFGHDFNGIVCARSDLEIANPDADPGIARMARQLLQAAPTSAAYDMTSQVRELVVMLLPTGTCTIDRAAQHLGIDRRTIHRHLAAEGQTFSRIVETIRVELAERYVKERRRALTEVASLLGFSAPSAFSRWYRQRFGTRASTRRTGAPRSSIRTSRR
jgi:AraC-like DNA-binding protein